MGTEEHIPKKGVALPVKIQMPGEGDVGDNVPDSEPVKPEAPELADDWSIFDSLPKISSSMAFALAGGLACAGAFLAMFSNSNQAWPSGDEIVSSVKNPPVYGPTDMEPFSLERGEYKWTLVPRSTIELHCLVLSEISPSRWTQVGEPGRYMLISADITGTWGKNVERGYYRKGQFGNTSEAEYAHNTYSSWNGNEHKYFSLIAGNSEVDKAIRQIKTGDQCRIFGVVATYFLEGSDAGERGVSHHVVYVTGLEFLHKHNHFKRLLVKSLFLTGGALFGISFFIKILPPEDED